MRVVRQGEALLSREASESDVTRNFMVLSQTESPMWVDLAVVLNSHDGVKKTVFLNQATVNYALVRVLRGSVLKRVLFLYCFRFLSGRLCIRISFIFNLDVDVVAIADKGSHKSIILVFVQRVHVTELLEHEVTGACVVESLGGELILARIRNSHGNIVVSAESANAAPEKKLLEVGVTAVVQQSLHSHIQAKSLFDVEALAVVFEHTKVPVKL